MQNIHRYSIQTMVSDFSGPRTRENLRSFVGFKKNNKKYLDVGTPQSINQSILLRQKPASVLYTIKIVAKHP